MKNHCFLIPLAPRTHGNLENTKENDNDIKQEQKDNNDNDRGDVDSNEQPLKKRQRLNKGNSETNTDSSIKENIIKYCQLSKQDKGKHQQIFRKDKIYILNEKQYAQYCQSNGFID